MTARFFSDYLKTISTGFEEIKVRVQADRNLPEEKRRLKWELSHFIRLDKSFLPEKANPLAIMRFQQVSTSLSEYAIRRLLNKEEPKEIKADFMIHGSLLFEIYLEEMESELEKEVIEVEQVGENRDGGHGGGLSDFADPGI